MTDLIKYPEWQPEYLAAMMEKNDARLPQKVLWAETAIFNRHQWLLAGRDGIDSAEELKALADAVKGLGALKLKHPGWK